MRPPPSATQGFLAPSVINQGNVDLNREEQALLKLGPRYIPNDPRLAQKRALHEIGSVATKINKVFVEHGWVLPKQRLEHFTGALEEILVDCHGRHPPSVQLEQIDTLKRKFEETKTVIRKTDKSKVFHLGKDDDYQKKARAYMEKTKAYLPLGNSNPLESLIERTNSFLYGLWVHKHISQRQYEKWRVDKNEAELAHLYFLPKAHKPATPLRPIMAGMRSPTIAISKWLDRQLRPLFDRLAAETTVANGTQLLRQTERWSAMYMTNATSFITMDVTDLYTMIPQEGGVRAIKKLLEACSLKTIDGVKKEIVLALARFVVTNNFFYLDGAYYQQIRGGAMGSPLTLTMANVFMFFVERPIAKWAMRTESLFYRYIDDLFIMTNVCVSTLQGLVRFWNRLDTNIELSATIGPSAEYLDVKLGNRGGKLVSEVFHKPSHEPYYLPFSSVHATHIKRNIPFGALVRAIRYCSEYDAFKHEEARVTTALLLNGYSLNFILQQFRRVCLTFDCAVPTQHNFPTVRKALLATTDGGRKTTRIDFEVNMLCHFSFCKGMHDFRGRFHQLWNTCFSDTAISQMTPIVGFRNLKNLHDQLVNKKPDRSLLKVNFEREEEFVTDTTTI